MSNQTNDTIIDGIDDLKTIVQFHREFWTGTLWDYMLEDGYNEAKATLNTKRIDSLLKDSSREMFDLEYRPNMEDYRLAYPKSPVLDTGFNLDGVPF